MSGQINFKVYPTSNRVPGVFAEIDPSLANTGQVNQRALLIGQMVTGGGETGTPGIPALSAGVGDAITQYGATSMLAAMVRQYRTSDTFGELWCLPLSDDPSSAAATGSIAIVGSPLNAGTLAIYIAGQRVLVPVNLGDSSTAIASNLAAAINGASPSLPVFAAAASGTVTISADNKGLAGNYISIWLNYGGAAAGEATPGDIGITITEMSGGATNPSAGLAAALANLGDMIFDFIAMPYSDATSLTNLETFLNDTTGRWSWQQELFGHYFACHQDTLANINTFGATRNSQHGSIMGVWGTPTPPWLWAADITANCAVSSRADPALPFNTIALNVLGPQASNRFGITARNTLLYDGISTCTVDDAGVTRIERIITTYQKNPGGAPDDSYLNAERMFTLAYLIRQTRIRLQTLFARKKLVSDGTRIPQGSNMVSPSFIRDAVTGQAYEFAAGGYMQNPDAFAQNVQAQDAGNGLVKLLLPWNLANQLEQIAMLIQFTST